MTQLEQQLFDALRNLMTVDPAAQDEHQMAVNAANEALQAAKEAAKEAANRHRHLLTGTYFETLSDTLDAIAARLAAAQAVPENPNWRESLDGHLPYETTRDKSFLLASLKGQPRTARRCNGFTVSIYRMPSGRYELVFYIA